MRQENKQDYDQNDFIVTSETLQLTLVKLKFNKKISKLLPKSKI